MTEPLLMLVCDLLCLFLGLVFFWSAFVVVVGLVKPRRRIPRAATKLRFAVLVCARNEQDVIRMPIKSVMMSNYPKACREVIVLADNCTDETVPRALAAGATVWEKHTPSSGKGDVLAWGIDRVLHENRFDAVAVFDADNAMADNWFDAMNDALVAGECVVTGRRHSSNATANLISGWYTVYWDVMNELSNRVRTNLGLSGKLTGTGFAFLLSALDGKGWNTRTMVEDVEFSVQVNLRGRRVAYVAEADYVDEQPVTVLHMWRQLCRWTTGGWQVAARYLLPWLRALLRKPSLRLFDSYFAVMTGISVAFIHLFNIIAFACRLHLGLGIASAGPFFLGIVGFVFVMGWFMAVSSVALSPERRRPRIAAIATFPLFSLVLSASVLYTLIRPTRVWKPIPHTGLTE